MTTISNIAEQIQLQYKRMSGLNDAPKTVLDKREIKPLIVQVANTLMKAEAMGKFQVGDLLTPPCVIATFGALAVSVSAVRSKCTLPVYPLSLPRGLGLWSVNPITAGNDGTSYIPITSGDKELLAGLDEFSLEGQIGFYLEGRDVFFTAAPTATVKAKVLLTDISTLSDTDLLPVAPEIESAIISGVLQIIQPQPIPPTIPNDQPS